MRGRERKGEEVSGRRTEKDEGKEKRRDGKRKERKEAQHHIDQPIS